ncbi:hypothetical protein ONS95_012599 [Cadophora gregata]|uniref:uncharacterized protein n=1 Tax=Cadophora gregata TaxID=51156 RepID=UPI0026DAC5A9|nr:uncharacterized protein ONS95_012599 [Cadophora gregata]KAK0118305.1 hypothetical protein ONS95_012599 [Cadophora gregata]KAK0123372.1 hypothetical protein ONS96_010364 [Cadophora gregata f. sp. sojae]
MSLDKTIWDEEVPVPLSTISYVDGGILKKLPPGTTTGLITPSGASYWARTAHIEATNVHQGEHGKNMVASEFHAMSELYKVMPEMVALPVGWGSYENVADTHFFVCKFHEMSHDIPDCRDFPAMLAEMHKRGVSPNGKFGFLIGTFAGNSSQIFPVSDTWEECFTHGLKHVFANEVATHGIDEEFEMLKKSVVEKVIPRLLRPLETGGRSITPRLVHGDLWDGNASVDVVTGKPMIFDGTPLYAHNEYEMAPWRASRHKMTKAYIDEYTKHFQVSEPAEEFDDRGDLYCLRFDTMSSSLYPGNLRFHEIAKETMRKLVAKYEEGYEGYAARHGLT